MGFRILLSAFACQSHRGSEQGVGWSWACALADAGLDVHVITRARNREAVERGLAERGSGTNPRFSYYDLPRWCRWVERGGRAPRLYYVLWQFGVFALARRLCREHRFDAVHHITFGVFRNPTLSGALGLPFVFGPVGGGERAPLAMRRGYPLRGHLADALRDVANGYARIDPLMRPVYRRAGVILCRTEETLRRIPRPYRAKCTVMSELGVEPTLMRSDLPPERASGRFKVLFVGRLLYWKGLHLGLRAFAELRRSCPGAELTIVGSGRDAAWYRGLSRALGVEAAVTWVAWTERETVIAMYRNHDAFLFPSLHDSGGTVVLEALACGLPVVCLALGGPKVLVDETCGFRVPARAPRTAVAALAEALGRLARDPALARAMSAAAVERARREFSWDVKVRRMERVYRQIAAGREVPPDA